MLLSKRLLFVTKFVDSQMIIADIGSDHGFLPYYLLQENIIQKAFASDNKIGPYNNLRKTFSSFDQARIELSLSNGIEKIPEYVNTIIITGMGGELIVKILLEGKDKLKNIDNIILSPHSHIEKVREFMMKEGYSLVDEGIVFDEKFYFVLKYQNGQQVLTKKELLFGPLLIKRKTEEYLNYLKELRKENENILANSLLTKEKRIHLNEVNLMIEEIMK